MKLISAIAFVCLAISAGAQSVTNLQVRAIAQIRAAQKMVELLSVLTQSEKAQLRAIIAAH